MSRRSHLGPAVLLLFLGCSFTHLYGETMRGGNLKARHRIHVVQHEGDKRQIDQMIATRLQRAGFEVTSGPEEEGVPNAVDAVVSYEDHWQWDMSNYLIVLRIDFREPQTQELLASGQSYRTSPDRRPPEFMVNEIVTTILASR